VRRGRDTLRMTQPVGPPTIGIGRHCTPVNSLWQIDQCPGFRRVSAGIPRRPLPVEGLKLCRFTPLLLDEAAVLGFGAWLPRSHGVSLHGSPSLGQAMQEIHRLEEIACTLE
jgi:hypothetical protein